MNSKILVLPNGEPGASQFETIVATYHLNPQNFEIITSTGECTSRLLQGPQTLIIGAIGSSASWTTAFIRALRKQNPEIFVIAYSVIGGIEGADFNICKGDCRDDNAATFVALTSVIGESSEDALAA